MPVRITNFFSRLHVFVWFVHSCKRLPWQTAGSDQKLLDSASIISQYDYVGVEWSELTQMH